MPPNKKNLKPPTTEEARERGKKGGEASAKARRKKKLMSEVANDLLNGKPAEKVAEKYAIAFGVEAQDMDNQMLILLAQFKKALEGDARAFELIRDTAGQKPVDKTELSGADGAPLTPLKIVVDFGENEPKPKQGKKNVNRGN